MGKTFTDATVTQVLTRIKEEIESNSGSGSVRYDEGQTLTDNQKAQARENIDAASATDVGDMDDLLQELNAQMQNMGVMVTNVVKTVDGKSLRIDFSDNSSKTIDIQADFPLKEVYYDTDTNLLHFLDSDEKDLVEAVYIQGGGGGGGETVGSIQIGYVSPSAMSCVYGNDLEIEFNLTCKDGDGDAVSGTGSWAVNGITVLRDIPYESRTHTEDGDGNVLTSGNIVNIGPYLQPGDNTVRLTISADVGGESKMTRTKSWTLSAVRMYFDWQFDDAQVSTGSFTDYWTVYGDISKTSHTLLDGVAQEELTTDRQSYTHSMKFTNLRHGVHTIERWLTATINGKQEYTDHQYHELVCAVAGNETPVIAISMQAGEMNQYDTIAIPVVVYDPTNITTTVTLSENGTVIDTWEDVDRTVHYWYYTPTESGAKSLTVTCRGVSKTLIMDVNEVEMGNVDEVEGYTFRFKASELTSNKAIQNWSSEGVNATFSDNFDWINGGLQTETDENGTIQQFVCVKAGTTMTINHGLFSTDPRRNGMTFKMIFKVTRCRSYDAKFMTCMDDNNIGIEMYAHKAFFRSSGQTINVPYNEDDYIELEFEVYPAPRQDGDGRYRYMMAWADGVITTCRLYGETDIFTHINPANIVIGSEDCDVNVYMIKAYPMKISLDQHIDNFIMDAPNAAEMVRRYNRNDILTDQEIDYNKLLRQNKDCRVWLYKIDYLPVNKIKKDPVPNCEFHQRWSNGDDYYQMDGMGTMGIQGTSSMDYILGAANTDFEFTSLTDGYGNDLLAGGVQNKSLYGNNLYAEDADNPGQVKVYTVEEAVAAAKVKSQDALGAEWVAVERQDDADRTPTKYIKAVGMKLNDDSCPITYSNTKVNFASCEQVNNMCNAAWYQKYNPYPSLTARDCMEFNMGVQFIQDSGTVPDSKHFVLFGDERYHMYSIANMGTSKKNVHVFHDISNPNEVCIEVKDNSLDQERMVNPNGLSKENYFDGEDWSGDYYYEMRYPDADPTDEVIDAWYDFVWWMTESDPQQATGNALGHSETYEPYTFKGHDRGDGGILKGVTVSQYAGTYTHDTFERRMAKMLSECEDHMVMDSFIYHFLYLERHTMQDNVSKNNFWSSSDIGSEHVHWDLSKAYDMDTSDGNNNQGQLVFDYGNEFDDWEEDGAKRVFNGGNSTWFVFCGHLYEALQVMFQNREAAGAWSATAYHKFLTDQQKKVPERCWVQCYWYDYMRPYEQGIHDDGWLTYLDGGQKIHQRAHYEYYEELYESSKFRGSVSTANNINFRAYTPPYWGGVVTTVGGAQIRRSASNTATAVATVPTGEVVHITAVTDTNWRAVEWSGYSGYMMITDLDALEPKGELTITMYNKMYIGVGVGTSRLDLVRAERNTPYKISFDDKFSGEIGNMVVSVYTAPMVQAISGIEQLYPDTCNFSAGIRLREISVGSSKSGYSNPNLAWLSLNNNTLLERLYAQNQPNANSVLDLSNCPSLEYLDATGSGFTGYNFANGGLISEATLQKPTTLSLINLQYLTDAKFKILDYSGLISLRHENTPGVDSMNLVTKATALQFARLIGIDWSMANTTQLERLVAMKGLDESGYTTDDYSVVTGKAYTLVITKRNYDRFEEAWPNLTVTYAEGGMVPQYVVSFVNADGKTPIFDRNGHEYVQYVDYDGEAYDPVAADEIDTPTKEPTQEATYIFDHWDNLEGKVTAEKTVTAVYLEIPNVYTVRWFLDAGLGPAKTMTDVAYGTEVVYEDETHETPGVQNQYGTYKVFSGWNRSTGFITGDTDVYANYVTGSLPAAGTELKNMNVAQIYAVAQADQATNYWSPKDYIEIRMGDDYDFEQGTSPGCVESQVLVENRYFDGTESSIYDTGIKLFDENTGDWTIAIDYEFNKTSSSTLASCYSNTDAAGLKLRYYNSAPQVYLDGISFNLTSNTGSNNTSRGIVVMRHRKGSSTLYIASDYHNTSGFNWNIATTNISSVKDASHDATLILGGTPLADGGYVELAAGWIYWCKIWYADLGTTVIKKIANMPRQTYRWEYDMPTSSDATGRYLLSSGAGYCKASFWMHGAMDLETRMNTTRTNIDGWYASEQRTFANTRILQALPMAWQGILAQVRIGSSAGNNGSDILYSADKIYMPSYTEIMGVTSEPYASEAPQGAIRYMTNVVTRSKWAGLTIPDDAQYITYSSDPSGFLPQEEGETQTIPGYTRTLRDGDIWKTSNGYYADVYYYISAETAAKHIKISNRTNGNMTAAASGNGYWIRNSYGYWTRSPYYYSGSSTTAPSEYFVQVYYGYSGSSGAANSYYEAVYGFSI